MKKKIKLKLLFIISVICIIILSNLLPIYASSKKLIPIGKTTGIILDAKGLIISGFTDEFGNSPAREAGLKKGDIILSINNKKVSDKETLTKALSGLNESEILVEVLRNNFRKSFKIKPIYDSKKDSLFIGIKVKDSIAGIGTITYIDPTNNDFGALGHGICDKDTSVSMFSKGNLVHSSVTNIDKGEKGNPGELIGSFDMSKTIGSVDVNSEFGIFGNINDVSSLCIENAIEVASSQSAKKGKAYILSNIENNKVEKYEIEITDLNYDKNDIRQMLIKITDPRLLSKTGGIVQGMSGSPIIQDNKLLGAVTHVLINDPTSGYGIFIDNMLKAAG